MFMKTVRNSLPGHLTSNFFFLPYLPWPQVHESSRFNYRPMVSDSSIKFEAWEPSPGKHDASGVETTPLTPPPPSLDDLCNGCSSNNYCIIAVSRKTYTRRKK